MATSSVIPAKEKENGLHVSAPVFRPRLLILSLSVIGLLCCSLELELLEHVDSLTWYMTPREILWDASYALLIVLGVGAIWLACLICTAKLAAWITKRKRGAVVLAWRLGIALPLTYFMLDLVRESRLRFLPGWHLGPRGWLCVGPLILLLCLLAVWRPKLESLQVFCRTRLAPIGLLHILLASAGALTLWAHGVHFFHDYFGPSGSFMASNRPDIYLITVDALRAEDMSVYGYSRPTTPNLEHFAQHATTFDFFFANSNFTTTATTSIETGKLPWSHRVFQLGGFLRDEVQGQTLPALLRRLGYYTASVSANPVASPIQHRTLGSYDAVELALPKIGISAFVRISNIVGLNTLYTLDGNLLRCLASARLYLNDLLWYQNFPSPAEFTLQKAQRIAERHDITQPRFIWAHVLPPHDPYLPEAPYRGRFLASSKLTSAYDFAGLGNDAPPSGVTAYELRARYDEVIASTDHALGNFLNWLEQTGRMDTSIVIISADHGESFEHGWFKHTGPYLYNGLIRIPLLIHLPGQKQATRVTQPAEQVDLLPTILDLIGQPSPPWSEGISLLPTIEGKALPDRPLFTMNLETNSVFQPITHGTVAAIDDNFKYIERLDTHSSSLYAYKTDPSEDRNLTATNPAVAKHMSDLIAEKLREINAQPAVDFFHDSYRLTYPESK